MNTVWYLFFPTGQPSMYRVGTRAGAVLAMLVLAVGAIALVTPALGQQAALDVRGSQSIPEQTLTISEKEFQTSALRIADPGNEITVDSSAGTDQFYRVYIYDSDEQIVAQRPATGDETSTFDLSEYDPGGYLVTISLDGETVAIHPLIVRGYEVSVTAPAEAETGGEVRLEAEATKLRGPDFSRVEFVITNGDDRVRKNATTTDPYGATLSLDGLPADTYEVYATVRGTETAFGENVILGLNEGATLDVADPTPTPTPTATAPSGGGSSGSGGESTSTVTATSTAATPTPAPTMTLTTSSPSTATPTPTRSATTPSGTLTQTPTANAATPTATVTPTGSSMEGATTTPAMTTAPADGDIITPNESSGGDDTATTSAGQPGLGAVSAVVALLCGILLARRRH